MSVQGIDRNRVFAIFEEGYKERLHQAERWGGGSLDKLVQNDALNVQLPETWQMWMDRYKGTWNEYAFPCQYTPALLKRFRSHMVKVMMLAVAAIIWVDGKLANEQMCHEKIGLTD